MLDDLTSLRFEGPQPIFDRGIGIIALGAACPKEIADLII